VSQILEAEGDREAQILRADGQAQAVKKIADAAEGALTERAMELRKIEMLEKTLKDNTKYIIPGNSNLVNLLDLEGKGLLK